MSAFGVVLIGFGVLMVWAGIKRQKVNEILITFINSGKPAKPQTLA